MKEEIKKLEDGKLGDRKTVTADEVTQKKLLAVFQFWSDHLQDVCGRLVGTLSIRLVSREADKGMIKVMPALIIDPDIRKELNPETQADFFRCGEEAFRAMKEAAEAQMLKNVTIN